MGCAVGQSRALLHRLELEAKGRLDDIWGDAPRLGIQANVAFFQSRVQGVPGPNNRIDEQPKSTFNLGVDYRLRALPLTFGASWNEVPAYDTRLSATQSASTGRKSVVDAYALWTVNDKSRLRLSFSNLSATDIETGSTIDFDNTRETSRTSTESPRSIQLRLELKL
jgi:outer membrane receptor for ferrienterochelin and colicins